IWFDEGLIFRDDIRILEFDIEDNKENRNLIIQYVKEVLLKRFNQIAIYVKFIPFIEPVTVKVT
ncbi:MAG: hypothetical protein ACE5GV_15390, partial [Candidatus Scalindua sp.]